MSWKAAESIDAVRSELRNAIFWTTFQMLGGQYESKERENTCRQGACAFAEFGVRSGLLEPSEGNEWLDAIWGRKVLAEVADKYGVKA